MDFKRLSKFENDLKYSKSAKAWEDLLEALSPFEVGEKSKIVISSYNQKHGEASTASEAGKQLRKANLALQQSLVKNDKLFRQNYNRDTWIAIGVGGIGVPIGLVIGTALGSMGFIGLGMPIGMVIGILIGRNLDQKAEKEGKVYSVNS
jgi:hypothetical protein